MLSARAVLASASKGRERQEAEDPLRTCFQRDRDRIIHSKAFRRLKQKTQVFISPVGDHYRTRLTHSLEVAQVSRTIARALRLNEDLTESIALGHDLGHPPFGHAGEKILNEIHPAGFYHQTQSIRILTVLEDLNLTGEVLEGIRGGSPFTTLEAQVVNTADRMAYPIYEVIAEYKLPAIFHTGHSGIGTGMPGGGGIRLKYGNPMLVDDVAVDFPDMPIILAHPSFPWQEEALSVATHKPQVYIDLSGWSPKYFPPILVQYANTLLKDKILFGSDYPVIAPEKWMAEFDKLPIKPEVRPLIMKQNAARLLGLK